MRRKKPQVLKTAYALTYGELKKELVSLGYYRKSQRPSFKRMVEHYENYMTYCLHKAYGF